MHSADELRKLLPSLAHLELKFSNLSLKKANCQATQVCSLGHTLEF